MADYPTAKNVRKLEKLPMPLVPSTVLGEQKSGKHRKLINYFTYALRCPLCNTEFTSEVPDVPFPRERDTDLRPRYGAVDPLPTLIHSCPSCKYTAYRQGFGHRENIEYKDEEGVTVALQLGDRSCAWFVPPEEEELKDLRRWIGQGGLVQGSPFFREPFGAERYLLGAWCYDFLHEDEPLGVADYLLRASWCARLINDLELEKYCQCETINRLQHAIDNELLLETEHPRTLYLIGELLRRIGEYTQAVNQFTQMESILDTDEKESSFFLSLAKRQALLAMVKSNVNGVFIPAEIQKTEREC